MNNEELKKLVEKYCPCLEYNDMYSWFVLKNTIIGVINVKSISIIEMFERFCYIDNSFQTLDKENEPCMTWDRATKINRTDTKTIIEVLKKLYLSYKKIIMKLKMDRIEQDF